MATLEAFFDHFDNVPAEDRAWRSSLRFNRHRSPDRGELDIGKAVLWALVLASHAALFVALDLLMQHAPLVLDDAEQPENTLQLRVIRPLHVSIAEPIPELAAPAPRNPVREAVKPVAHSTQTLQAQTIPMGAAEHSDALQVQTISPSSATSWTPPPTEPRDPFARLAAGRDLPGAATAGAPTLRMRDPLTPQRVVAKIGALFGGGFADPCPDYEARLMSGGSEAEREDEMQRYERGCPNH